MRISFHTHDDPSLPFPYPDNLNIQATVNISPSGLPKEMYEAIPHREFHGVGRNNNQALGNALRGLAGWFLAQGHEAAVAAEKQHMERLRNMKPGDRWQS